MKKLIALTLALAMILTLAPSVFAADTGWEWAREAKSFVYSFGSEAHTSSTGKDMQYFRTVSQTIDNTSDGYQKWGFVNFRGENAYSRTGGYTEYLPYVNENGPVYDPGEAMTGKLTGDIWRNAFAVELDIEESGTYNTSLDFKTYKYAPIVDVYLIEKPTANWADDIEFYYNIMGVSGRNGLPSSARIGKNIDLYASTHVMKSTELLPVTLDASKNYYLIIVPVGMHDTPLNHVKSNLNVNDRFGDARVWLYNFTLSQRLPSDAQTLNYVVKKTSLSSKLPTSSDTQQGIYTNGYVYNLSYFDWETTSQLVDDATAEKGVSVDENIEPYKTLDLTKTAPFKIEKGAKGFNNPMVQNPYIVTGLYTSYYGKTPIGERAHLAFRLNVPYAGQYKLEVVKNGGTTPENSAFMKVYFGKAADVYNATDIQSKIDSGDYAHLGWYNFYEGMYTKETIAENKVSADYYTVDIPSAGEYHLVLDACSESLTFNNYSGTQFFRLGQVNLIPVPGTLSEAEVKVNAIKTTMTADIATESTDAPSPTATVKVLTRAIDGNDAVESATVLTGNVGTTLTANASDVIDGYEFLYWEKGYGADRRAVWYEPEYSFKATSGGAWLTAVYRNTSS
ncbi:MAG: hypothetical protein IJF32_02690, partial [Oscillospiraceae bacterium]|nr:hypothetical protein [Oscillospiraceae bacterium]